MSAPAAPVEPWWAGAEHEVTHEVTFRPVVRLRVAVPAGADVDEVVAAATASWARALEGCDDEGRRWVGELWFAALGDDALVVDVEVLDNQHSVRQLPPDEVG